jgi:hypothetical protein
MSREIKFRAWHFVSSDPIDPTGKHPWTMTYFKLGDRLPDRETLAVMQYTGLKDKNGVEIYEGDKIRWGHMKHYYIVEYNPDNVCFQATNGFATGRFDRSDVEVIGNIYENSDMLKSSNGNRPA